MFNHIDHQAGFFLDGLQQALPISSVACGAFSQFAHLIPPPRQSRGPCSPARAASMAAFKGQEVGLLGNILNGPPGDAVDFAGVDIQQTHGF